MLRGVLVTFTTREIVETFLAFIAFVPIEIALALADTLAIAGNSNGTISVTVATY